MCTTLTAPALCSREPTSAAAGRACSPASARTVTGSLVIVSSRRVAEKLGMRLHGRCTADQTASWRPVVDVLVYVAGRDVDPVPR